LQQHKQQSDHLQGLEKEQRTLVKELQRESKKVQKELEKQRKQLSKLNAEIDRIIEAEIEAQRKREEAAARARAAKSGGKSSSSSSAERSNTGVGKLNADFVKNKGKLPVPVTGPYQVVSEYGKRKGVMGKGNVLIDNGGIVIQGRDGAQARCIFEGQVAAVYRNDDYALVLVRHDKYISVYCQLEKIHVKNGQKVSAGTIIGDVARDASGHTRLLFQLRKEKQKLNPQQWLNYRTQKLLHNKHSSVFLGECFCLLAFTKGAFVHPALFYALFLRRPRAFLCSCGVIYNLIPVGCFYRLIRAT